MAAEKAVYLTNTETSQPTLFDILAASNLNELMKPVVDHVSDFAVSSFPRFCHLSSVIRRSAWLIANLLVDGYCLSKNDGLFSEVFYGIKRNGDEKKWWRTKTLLFSTIIRMKGDIDSWYESVHLEIQRGALRDNSFRSRMIRLLTWLYPIINFGYGSIDMLFHFLYVMGRTSYATSDHWITGTKVVNVIESDSSLEKMGDSRLSRFFYVCSRLGQMAITLSIFLLQSSQWYSQASQTSASNEVSTGTIPLPPTQMFEKLSASLSPKQCPICLHDRKNTAALTVSGILFCYACIKKYVEENHMCPISRYPANVKSIIRVYK